MILTYTDGLFAHLLSLWVFIILMVGTPGPANLLIMAIGSQYGIVKAMRFNVGLVSGKLFLNLAMAMGVGVFMTTQPVFLDMLKYLSGAFIIYLSHARSEPSKWFWGSRYASWRAGLIVHPST